MGTRSKYSQNRDWDPMRDDYNNSTYDSQYPDDDTGGAVNLDHCRLYVTNIPRGLNDEGLRSAFNKYGTLTEVFISTDPSKRYGLVSYETPGEAKLAMTKLNRTDPLRMNINIAHKKKQHDKQRDSNRGDRTNGPKERQTNNTYEVSSNSSLGKNSLLRRQNEDMANGDNDLGDSHLLDDDLTQTLDPDITLSLEQLKLEQLKLQEAQLMCKHRILLKQAEKKASAQSSATNRSILPDGRIVVRNVTDRAADRDAEGSFTAGAGDSNERDTICSCKAKMKRSWDLPCSSNDGSSTPSTCVLCSDDSCKSNKRAIDTRDSKVKSEINSRYTDASRNRDPKFSESKTTDITSRKSMNSKMTGFTKTTEASNKSGATSHKLDARKKSSVSRNKSDITCDLKYSDFYSDNDDEADETNRLIQLRNSDYLDIVDDCLKIVVALAGYPKSKMRLRQMEVFQRCLTDIMDMQLKEGLLKKVPSFLDYYLNRGAIVCICKDLDTRNWMVRISPGLQERMYTNLILLKGKVKRLCLALLKIPQTCWPATAQDAFKLLQYFNPTLKIDSWKIYAQKTVDDVECTSFLIDRVSGEIIRGPNFKNVIDYNQMEFELTGYTEIYYECLISDVDDDLCSVSSRVKLLEEIRSEEMTPKNAQSIVSLKNEVLGEENVKILRMNIQSAKKESDCDVVEVQSDSRIVDVKEELEKSFQNEILKKLKDMKYISNKNEVIIWSDDLINADRDCDDSQLDYKEERIEVGATSAAAISDRTESMVESNENVTLSRNSNVNIDSNRGIAYHRRTNYLHIENELKIAITLEGYPQNKLEGTHIRRLKHLFKEYLHKDMKNHRFTNLIIPKFQDIYLSNGAVIYVCDSLETKDYLSDILPKFINSTGLKLTFRDIKDLVRYTRIVMRLPKEHAHIESADILLQLQSKYPGLKLDCWKYYSDVAGKQKRQFGVDPESLKVIKEPDFDPSYEGEKLSFRIINRQKRDVSFEEPVDDYEDQNDGDNNESKKTRDKVMKYMYSPIDPEILNAPLTRVRTEHYSDLIADDLKLYVGPSNYPETRIDEVQFHTIRRTLENIVRELFENGQIDIQSIPKFHDVYLFDGVIFIICQDVSSRLWIEKILPIINLKLHIDLKCTEFRGAVGIISMYLKTEKDTEEVIEMLQKQNPRLRTKFWRKISTVRTKTKLDVVLQIDKLSAQVITSQSFNKFVGGSAVQFKLGHLQSLLKPKASLEELSKAVAERAAKKCNMKSTDMNSKKLAAFNIRTNINKENKIIVLKSDPLNTSQDNIGQHLNEEKLTEYPENLKNVASIIESKVSDLDPMIIEPESPQSLRNLNILPVGNNNHPNFCRMILKIPLNVLPDSKEDLNIIFDLLEDKNPGLNTELWEMSTETAYPNSGKIILLVDNRSASIIKSKSFDSTIGGEKLKFYF